VLAWFAGKRHAGTVRPRRRRQARVRCVATAKLADGPGWPAQPRPALPARLPGPALASAPPGQR